MQNKGLIKVFAILFGLACIYQLSFTFITSKIEDNASAFANEQISNTEENYAEKRNEVSQSYLDSIASEPYFAGITYEQAQQKELNLGLDLKGGINVILQISVKDLLIGLANGSEDEQFRTALQQATEKQKSSQESYINLFFESFDELEDAKLSSPDIFDNIKLRDEIDFNMTNAQVQPVIDQKIDESITSAFEVLRERIDKFGVTQPNIQRLGESGRILVELPGAKDIGRIQKLLRTTAQLEFWHVFQANDFQQFLRQADQIVKQKLAAQKDTQTEEKTKETDTTAQSSDDLEELLATEESEKDSISNNPLMSLVQSVGNPRGPVIATFALSDTARVNSYLEFPEIQNLLTGEKKFTEFAWGKSADDSEFIDLYALKTNRESNPPLDGSVIVDAGQDFDQVGRVVVGMQMNGKGAKIWEKMTGKASKQGTQIAIVLDGTVYSAPGVSSGAISGGRSQISGDFTIKEAKDLATVLQAGKLPAKTKIIQSEIVGPSLGNEAINSGINSFIIALILVLIWMIFYYGKAGAYSDIALVVNILFIFGILAGLEAVLTLPGIAGIVLTIGMSVDANVLIFERIREELQKGKKQPDAIKDGFKNSLSSILDANITTGLTGLILLVFGTGPIKGFATTLLIGIATSLFTAIFITRLFIDAYTSNNKLLVFTSAATKNFLRNISKQFLNKRKVGYVISGALIVLSIISLSTRGLNQGIDFVGGRNYTVRFEQSVNPTEVANNLQAGLESVDVKTYGSNNQIKISTKYKVDEQGEEVENEIQKIIYNGVQELLPTGTSYEDFKVSSSNSIGVMSSIKVGPSIADDIKTASFYAIIGSFIVVFLYILFRFRKWQFSVGAVSAVVHDVLIVLGIFSATYSFMPFDMEINQAFIAAILTVIGYSLNDTVVVFDRIREYFNVHPKWPLSKIIDQGVSSMLGRTLNTSFTTLVVLIAIFAFGGESIRGFMFALIIGVIVGTYSSIFVATPIMFDTAKKRGIDLTEKKEEDELGEKATTTS
ncbi:MAG: protein translocase subunit SecDF [Psychroflexus sp.]|nr:protein translocase subunit SecDF [Psychroflexus sp.]MDR9448266.1 protein translocase subunit SecDF [Psychroflexus sp.]